MKTVIIGDIHGCYDELIRLLDEVDFDSGEDTLISIGDLMDRGEKSYEVLSFFMEQKENMGDRCRIIRGNHEEMFLGAAGAGDIGLWIYNGAESTIRSFEDHGKNVYDYADWVAENTKYYYREERYQCVHAGLEEEDPADNEEDVLIWDRWAVDRNDYRGKLTIVGHTPFPAPMHLKGNGKSRILRNRRVFRLPKTGLICIDTGCVYGYCLTALVIVGERCYAVSVPSAQGNGGGNYIFDIDLCVERLKWCCSFF